MDGWIFFHFLPSTSTQKIRQLSTSLPSHSSAIRRRNWAWQRSVSTRKNYQSRGSRIDGRMDCFLYNLSFHLHPISFKTISSPSQRGAIHNRNCKHLLLSTGDLICSGIRLFFSARHTVNRHCPSALSIKEIEAGNSFACGHKISSPGFRWKSHHLGRASK